MPQFVFQMNGVAERLVAYEDRVTIQPTGVMGLMLKGLKGTKTIPYGSITGIQFKEAGALFSGYIQFTIPGGNESKGGVFAAASDENTFMFANKTNNELATKIKEYIESAVLRMRTPQGYATAPVTDRDEVECPHCAEIILRKAKVCKHCGREVVPQPTVESRVFDWLDGGEGVPPSEPKKPTITGRKAIETASAFQASPPTGLESPPLPSHESDDEFFRSLDIGVDLDGQSVDARLPPAVAPPPSDFIVTCTCGARLKANTHKIGKTVRCPKCRNLLKVENVN